MTLNEPLIAQVPLFAALPPHELRYLAATLRLASYPHGALLFREGDYGDRFYIVLEGELEIIKALDTASEFMLGARGPGEVVGEMSVLSPGGLRPASVRARGTTRLLEMSYDEFDALLHRQPRLAYEMVRVLGNPLIRYLREKNRQLTQAYLDLQVAQAQIIEQETLARELQVARSIQEHMLPRTLPDLAGFDFSACMMPARMVSGDFYDFIPLDTTRLGASAVRPAALGRQRVPRRCAAGGRRDAGGGTCVLRSHQLSCMSYQPSLSLRQVSAKPDQAARSSISHA